MFLMTWAWERNQSLIVNEVRMEWVSYSLGANAALNDAAVERRNGAADEDDAVLGGCPTSWRLLGYLSPRCSGESCVQRIEPWLPR